MSNAANDQAEGLRQMFAHTRVRFIPVVSNPHVAFGGVLLERLCTAFAERQATTLVVDAAERAGEAGEMAMVDLGQCIERLSDHVSYLAARGLPLRFVDAAGSTRGFLQRVAEAAPRCDVVLVHASAPELCRLFSQKRAGAAWSEAPCPIVLAEDHPDSVTHAYAASKLLAHRAGLVVFDFVLGAASQSPRGERIVTKFAACTDMYFGAVLRSSARIDPAGDAGEAPGHDLRQLVAERLRGQPRRRPDSSSTTTATLRSTVVSS
ncbi:MAG: flagellar biosynthesis protein [Pseudomonadota bacterium]|nr:flagellar biosynthesis protein [Pseudomonadota bacterium]